MTGSGPFKNSETLVLVLIRTVFLVVLGRRRVGTKLYAYKWQSTRIKGAV